MFNLGDKVSFVYECQQIEGIVDEIHNDCEQPIKNIVLEGATTSYFIDKIAMKDLYIVKQPSLEIRKLLRNWRVDRLLYQYGNIVANLLEEVTEYYRAKDVEEQIDALCDIIVFSINAGDLGPNSIEIDEKCVNEDTKGINLVNEIIKEIAYLNDVIFAGEEDIEEPINNIIKYAMQEIKKLGYVWFLCVEETIKEISSRTGKIDPIIGKWVKDKVQKNPYKANYSKCKI